jgi:hypothetical protein
MYFFGGCVEPYLRFQKTLAFYAVVNKISLSLFISHESGNLITQKAYAHYEK